MGMRMNLLVGNVLIMSRTILLADRIERVADCRKIMFPEVKKECQSLVFIKTVSHVVYSGHEKPRMWDLLTFCVCSQSPHSEPDPGDNWYTESHAQPHYT